MLKCWIGNYDGVRQGCVISTSQRKAAKIARCGVRTFVDYWAEQEVWLELQKRDNLKPDTLYTRRYDGPGGKPFTEGRCP